MLLFKIKISDLWDMLMEERIKLQKMFSLINKLPSDDNTGSEQQKAGTFVLINAGVEITTRQLAKCEWNLELASILLNLLASLASVFSLLSVSLFSPLIESYSSSIPKYKHTPDTVIYLLS
jgi:hypothetical protein